MSEKILNRELVKRERLTEKIVQFGEGNFLRAFANWMIDKMNKEANYGAGVVVVQPIDRGLVTMLNDQDGLYTLYLNGIKNGEAVSEHEVIDCITRGIDPYADNAAYMSIAENPDLEIMLSNTTEAGISFNPDDKLEDTPQKSFPGKLTALLFKRYQTFSGDKSKGLVLIPCELIDKNGIKLKETILQYAELWKLGEGFTAWINEACSFCNTLVDRIVPGYPREKIGEITEELGYKDNLVVEGEQFHLWVIEGDEKAHEVFPADKVGLNVLFVKDQTPYRTRKVRILNGAHTTMVPVGYLYGIDTVRETVEHEVMGKFVKGAVDEEIIPTLDLPKEELESFSNDVMDRFRNPFIKHFLISISLNSMPKYETRVLPSLLEYVNRKQALPKKLVFSLASLISFYKGDRNGEEIPLKDNQDVLDLYKELWTNCDGSKEAIAVLAEKVLAYEPVWKQDLNKVPGLTDLTAEYVSLIQEKGMQEAIKAVL
ncbi:tagaturonate reductase [Flammeovirgaceae bacterium SG7u.111]|nr:tagaturonate reductase [Flammeovirgaceae bacterium SG7u.132]WPO36617.1 tagaturonate reductase [Flammeovirgaceae bacterium SG7u.111]